MWLNRLNTHEPWLQDIVSHLKTLTGEGHHIHLCNVKAHSGVRGNIQADHQWLPSHEELLVIQICILELRI